MKRIPYGISDYKTLIEENYVFVDKTKYIEKLENYHSPYIFFLRPRRFGKSLFTSMLSYYYDVAKESEFDSLFSDTYIGKNITPKHNGYFILSFTFSSLNTDTGETLKNSFLRRSYDSFISFLDRYNIDVKLDFENTEPAMALSNFFTSVRKHIDKPIYVIIDEYDHFANELLSFKPEVFKDLVSKTGFVRKWYEMLKDWTKEENMVKKIFATGVAPITLDSMTSGFNIAKNITRQKNFNEMIGFTEIEVREIIKSTSNIIMSSEEIEELIGVLKRNYNGYLFSEDAKTRMFNSDMILYYMQEFVENGTAPVNLIDENIASDYSKVGNLFNLATNESSFKIIDKILRDDELIGEITNQFSLEKDFTSEDFLSLMFYLGFITIQERELADVIYRVPNEAIKGLYFDFFAKKLSEEINAEIDISEIKAAVKALAIRGNNEALVKVVEKTLNKLSNRDFIAFDEKYIKIIIIAYLNLSKSYLIKSEYEVEDGYIDIALLNNHIINPKYYGIIELKYITKTEYEKFGEELVEKRKQEAIEQINKYKTSEELMKVPNFKKWVIVFVKDKCVINLEIE